MKEIFPEGRGQLRSFFCHNEIFILIGYAHMLQCGILLKWEKEQ